MVSSSIANALVSTAAPTGHLPVYLDMRVPPAIVSTQTIDFGIVPQGAVASKSFFVANSGNTAIWTPAGIATLTYTMSASGPFTAHGLLIGGRVDVAPTGGGRSRLQGALISLGEARIDGAVDLRHDRALLERLMPLPGALLMVPGSWFDPPRR